jgi:uncharacterized protein YcbX
VSGIGRVAELALYPVKSMAGTALPSAVLGWHGLEGDRRFALRRVGDRSGFPWLSASRLPALVLYRPVGLADGKGEPSPTHVRTPAGSEWELESEALCTEIAGRLGSAVEMMRWKHGVFDEACVSVISRTTIEGIGREAGLDLDPRRFRANVVLETEGGGGPFLEDAWVGRRLAFGDGEGGPAVAVTARDERCVMVDFDPQTAERDARVQKAVVRLNGNMAGVYATVVRTGTIRVGDRVRLE